ncbi:MAG: transposase [Bacilli bacterium]
MLAVRNKCPERIVSSVTNKQFRLRTFVLEPNTNKSVPIGTIACVREYLTKLGFDDLFDNSKSKGHPLFQLVCAIISYRLTENFSVEGCGRWLESSEVRNELGIRSEVSHRAINRAVERCGEIMPEVLSHLRKALFSMYDLEHTDVNIDTTSVAVYAKGTGLYDFGYSRDKRPDLRQVNFGAAELRDPINIPIDLSVDRGNASDSVQFVKIVDDIIGDLRDDSLFVFDAGGDAKQVLDRITEKGHRYITRKRMNKSDDLWISGFDRNDAVCVDVNDGVYCQRKIFESSGRTVYLFYSEKLYRDKMAALDGRSWRCVEDAKDVMRRKRDGTLCISKTVIKRLKNPLISLNVGVQGKLLQNDIDSFEYVREHLSNRREGFFKLECSSNLTADEVFSIYRRRDTVEKLMDSLKNHIDLKPMRVWSESSVKGTLLLCFLAQVIVSMIRYEMPELGKSSTKFIIDSLQNLTVTYVYDRKQAVRRVYSNFETLNSRILRDMVIVSGVSGG